MIFRTGPAGIFESGTTRIFEGQAGIAGEDVRYQTSA
jgi:hypothetical protein